MAVGKIPSFIIILGFCVVTAQVKMSLAVEFTVGDKVGWIVGPVNYTSWANSKRFHVGDTLVFSYNKQLHNVVEVTKTNYDTCTSTAPLASYTDGNTTVVLKKAGTHYYICGFPGHCVAGQKVEVTTLLPSGLSPSPSTAPKFPKTVTSKGPSLSPIKGIQATISSSVIRHDVSTATTFLAAILSLLVF